MYNIIELEILEEYDALTFLIEAELRDYEYNEDTRSNVSRVFSILDYMEKKYKKEGVIDLLVCKSFITFPDRIYGCRENIKEEEENITRIANVLYDYRRRILGSTFSYCMDEKNEWIIERRIKGEIYTDIERKCWDEAFGEGGYITVYKESGIWEEGIYQIFLKTLKEIISFFKELNIVSKNIVRLFTNLDNFYVKYQRNKDIHKPIADFLKLRNSL